MSAGGDLLLPWYAVQTQPHREGIAEMRLRTLGADVLCPHYRRRVILHGYRREVVRPLFPGYLFAAFDAARDLRTVHFAQGVRGVLCFGGEPTVVPRELIANIVARMGDDGCVALVPPPLRPGQRVEVTAGLLKGYTGIFDAERSDAERVVILLDTLNYNARALLDRDAVQALN